MKSLTILLIDDENPQLQSLKSFLSRRGYEVFASTSGQEGYHIAQRNIIDLVITDSRMPEWSGFTVLKKIKELNPDIDVVMMTAYGTVEDAVQIMKAGAYDYLSKPVDLDEPDNLVKRVQEKRQLVAENRLLKQQLQQKFNFDGIFYQSSAMEEVINLVARVAPSKTTVLVLGESGTGKELIARTIHYASPRKDRPCVVVNVAALSESLLESELFGHERGAFTGANQQRIGCFEQADGGTLFIDEVGDIRSGETVQAWNAPFDWAGWNRQFPDCPMAFEQTEDLLLRAAASSLPRGLDKAMEVLLADYPADDPETPSLPNPP